MSAFDGLIRASAEIRQVSPMRAVALLAEATLPAAMAGRVRLMRQVVQEAEELWDTCAEEDRVDASLTVLAAASAGLVLVVGAAQRRRSLVTLAVLGAGTGQRAAFLWTEARALTVLGLSGGLATGALVGAELIKVLTGIFDPPPERPAIPWGFVAALLIAVLGTAAVATAVSARWAARVEASHLRD